MYLFTKRLLDLVIAMTLCLLLSPIFFIIAIAIYLDSEGPVLFRQTRIGLNGRPFKIYKFRTLYVGAHEVSNPQAMVTSVGIFLRRWGLDELPQLFNILKNDMSLVGPRPTLPEQVARYSARERRRLQMRPGITGWAQIHGRNAIDWSRRIALDVEYVRNANLALDLMILVRTPFSLTAEDNTYGPSGKNIEFKGLADSIQE